MLDDALRSSLYLPHRHTRTRRHTHTHDRAFGKPHRPGSQPRSMAPRGNSARFAADASWTRFAADAYSARYIS